MTEHDFEVRLRAGLLAVAGEPVPATLRARVSAIPDTIPASQGRRQATGRGFPALLRFAPPALATVALVIVTLMGIGLLVRPSDVGPPPATGSPGASEAAATDGERINGWPTIFGNRAGVYSWDGFSCGPWNSGQCHVGFMHNDYSGSGDVEILIGEVPAGVVTGEGATAVTVAGYEGSHRLLEAGEWWPSEIGMRSGTIDGRGELWIVAIEGKTVAIELSASRGTSAVDLAEAHAIIESMRTEPRDNNHLGFRLIFTLTTDDWTSA
jgi:hypothetical protein